MTDCHIISDRMPAVAHGRDSWHPAEAAHLASCASCALEWELVRAAHAAGTSVALELDTGRIAGAVRRRLATAPVEAPPSPRRVWWLAGMAAAALVLFLFSPRGPRSSGDGAGAPQSVVSVLHELDGLNSSELEAVLESLPASAATISAPHLEGGSLDDLDAAELERVLHSLEG